MHLFDSIDDSLFSLPKDKQKKIFKQLKVCVGFLKNLRDDDIEQLKLEERQLGQMLRRSLLAKNSSLKIPLPVKEAFYQAYLLAPFYEETVGSFREMMSTCELKSLKQFKVSKKKSKVYKANLKKIEAFLGLPLESRTIIFSKCREAKKRLQQRRDLVDLLRKELVFDSSGMVTQISAKRLFKKLFPYVDVKSLPLNLVATKTCLYFSVPNPNELQGVSQKTKNFVKRALEFRFQQFRNFPVFSLFESRVVEPLFLKKLQTALGSPDHFFELFNSVCMIHDHANLEKYLIHDSWGHVWQADLTNMTGLYKKLSVAQMPLSPDCVFQSENSFDSFLDCFFVVKNVAQLDMVLSKQFIEADLRERLACSMTSLISEFCADITEYLFSEEEQFDLPSSSLFKKQPTKIDLTWNDIRYFVETFVSVNELYLKDQKAKQTFDQRLIFLLTKRYQLKGLGRTEKDFLMKSVSQKTIEFFNLYKKSQQEHLNLNFENINHDQNIFFYLYLNILQIQYTLNSVFDFKKEGDRENVKNNRICILLFIVLYFEKDPWLHFWNLDETLSKYLRQLLSLC